MDSYISNNKDNSNIKDNVSTKNRNDNHGNNNNNNNNTSNNDNDKNTKEKRKVDIDDNYANLGKDIEIFKTKLKDTERQRDVLAKKVIQLIARNNLLVQVEKQLKDNEFKLKGQILELDAKFCNERNKNEYNKNHYHDSKILCDIIDKNKEWINKFEQVQKEAKIAFIEMNEARRKHGVKEKV
ncbi:uncharacterized protein L201_003553 [Kwoniella dendrophila CBS 6074]|uniref:Uncharacterized protein n=1 Tax=Kwoniella dendrophila CBS 6074 TaxID=1295534 RepID=A0AAX4JVS7_9TREE